MEKPQRKRLEEIAASGIVGGDLKAALAEIDRLHDQVLRLVRGNFAQICSYCGWESPAGGATWEELQAHIHTCEKHPVALMGTALTYIAGSIGAREHERAIARETLAALTFRHVSDPGHTIPTAPVVIGQVATAADWARMESGEEFQTAAGDPAHQAANGEWLQPTENPFGHGCCDCGLYHNVEWRLVDDDGRVHDIDFLSMAAGPHYGNGIHLQLKFTRDEGETARLREYRLSSKA